MLLTHPVLVMLGVLSVTFLFVLIAPRTPAGLLAVRTICL